MNSPFLRMYDEVDCKLLLSSKTSRYIRQLEHAFIGPQNIVVDIDSCFIDFLYGFTWFIANPVYRKDNLDFEWLALQARKDAVAYFLCGWHGVE